MVAKIARLIGGAGTGKTSELLSIMAKTIEAGVDPMRLGFVSFTRAARGEAAERAAKQFGLKQEDLESAGWFRTLHSVCFKCLGEGRGELLAGGKSSREWMQNALQADVGAPEDGDQDYSEAFSEQHSEAGMALRLWGAARNRLEPLEDAWQEAAEIDERTPSWETVRSLVERYELHKRLDNRVDFTDLAGRFAGWKFGVEAHDEATPDGECPELPVWFFDEQQDTSRLLDSVCRRLISTDACRWVYVVGDPFQSIYGWAGADAACFREWEAEKERVMPKSYRCPAAILEAGEAAIRDSADYYERGIRPAEHEGQVDYAWWSQGALSEVTPESSWLLLARTNRLAMQLGAALDREGLPWVPTKGLGGWAAPKRNAGLGALLALQQGKPIDREEWRAALELVPAKSEAGELLARGTKTQWGDKSFRHELDLCTAEQLGDWGATQTLFDLITDGGWRGLVEGGERFASAAERWGIQTVLAPPVRVGTVHSVKGAEADNVLLLTTSTHQCAKAAENPRMRDEELRVSYVAITRARRRLIIAKERNVKHRMSGI